GKPRPPGVGPRVEVVRVFHQGEARTELRGDDPTFCGFVRLASNKSVEIRRSEKMRRAETSPCRIQDFGTPLDDVVIEVIRFVFGRACDAFHRRVDGIKRDFLSPFFPLLTELLRDDDVEFTTNDCRSLLQLLRDDYLATRLLEFGGFERRSQTR